METKNSNHSNVEFDSQLVEAVRKQIEYYFSKENLQNDVYLASQMDAQFSVPISVVMKFAKLKSLTQDEELVRQALVDSTAVTIVDNRIKPVLKQGSGRSTIILRDIPSDAPEEEVKEIFNYPGSKSIVSIRSEIGDTWFVVMETEEDAKDTCLDLRLKKRTFRSQAVKARIKTEPVARSYFPVGSTVSSVQYPMMPFPVVPVDLSSFGYLPVPPMDVPIPAPPTDMNSAALENLELGNEEADSEKLADEGSEVSPGRIKREPRRVASRPVREEVRRKSDPKKMPVASAAVVKETKEKKTEPTGTGKPPIEMNTLTFPPLQTLEDTPVPTPGYKGSYLKYNFDQIIAIVKNVKEAILPEDMDPSEHAVAMTTTPNMDLLKRQRTFSIDETREQLRQGRPVQREAVISGSVDYRSLMFGDESELSMKGSAKRTTDSAPSSSGAVSSRVEETPLQPPAVNNSAAEDVKPNNNDQPAPTENHHQPVSPARISASTWAAMVKSNAEAVSLAAPQKPMNNIPKSADNSSKPAPTVKSSSHPAPTTSEKADKAPLTPNRQKDKNSEKDRRQKSDRKKFRENGEQKQGKFDNANQDAEHDQQGAADHASNSGNVWGKSSFASVLRQQIPEDQQPSEQQSLADASKKTSHSPVRSSNTNHYHQNQKPLKQNSRGNALKDSYADNHKNHRGKHREERKQPSSAEEKKEVVEPDSQQV